MRKHTGATLALISSALLLTISSASAQQCPENADALGTSRVLTADPRTFPMVGRAQYRESLRLNKREVVLTFDSGPSYPYTESILKTLAAECIKATFFVLGSNAAEDPEQVRRIAQEGHSIGAQTFNHVSLNSLPINDAMKEVDQGFGALTTALKIDPRATRFFRAPMLELSPQLARYVVSKGMMVWGIDVDSQDWDEASEEQIVAQTMKGLAQYEGGIVALQDIQPATARALPLLIAELKREKYKIVHVVPAQAQAARVDTKSAPPRKN
jgi:peptidoglycan/xylan/chitin deacetylase (PgdA/CDA1 family)